MGLMFTNLANELGHHPVGYYIGYEMKDFYGTNLGIDWPPT